VSYNSRHNLLKQSVTTCLHGWLILVTSCYTVTSVGDGIVNWSILTSSKIAFYTLTHISISKNSCLKINVILLLSFELVPELSRPDNLALQWSSFRTRYCSQLSCVALWAL